jgi:hypothetical protein
MIVADIKEKASVVREERASSLKGFFNNCFVPPRPIDDDTTEKYANSENDTYIENATRIENATYIENNICSENDILESATCSETTTLENTTCSVNATYDGNTAKLAKTLGFTALGVFAVLIDEFPEGSGMLNVTQLSKSCGVARTTLITQLRSLEKYGAVSLGGAEKNGRWLEIKYIENATCR